MSLGDDLTQSRLFVRNTSWAGDWSPLLMFCSCTQKYLLLLPLWGGPAQFLGNVGGKS